MRAANQLVVVVSDDRQPNNKEANPPRSSTGLAAAKRFIPVVQVYQIRALIVIDLSYQP